MYSTTHTSVAHIHVGAIDELAALAGKYRNAFCGRKYAIEGRPEWQIGQGKLCTHKYGEEIGR